MPIWKGQLGLVASILAKDNKDLSVPIMYMRPQPQYIIILWDYHRYKQELYVISLYCCFYQYMIYWNLRKLIYNFIIFFFFIERSSKNLYMFIDRDIKKKKSLLTVGNDIKKAIQTISNDYSSHRWYNTYQQWPLMSSLIRTYQQWPVVVADIKLMSDRFVVADNNIFVVTNVLLSRTCRFKCLGYPRREITLLVVTLVVFDNLSQ